FTFLGLALGVTLLVKLPRSITLLALGIFVCLHAFHIVLRRESSRRLSRVWAAPAGVVGGVLGALFGTVGPPYVAYLTGRRRDAGAQRATISQMVILSVGLRVIIFAVAGLLFTRSLWRAVCLLLPAAWIGVKRLRVKRDRKSTRLNSSHGSISYAVFCLKKKKRRNAK